MRNFQPRYLALTWAWAFLVVFRNGLHFQPASPILLESVKRFPHPISFASSSLLPMTVLRVFHIDNQSRWEIFFGLLTLISLLSALLIIQIRTKEFGAIYTAIFASAPAVPLLMGNIGLPDLFLTLLWSNCFFGPQKFKRATLWAISITSPEQALVSFICIGFVEKFQKKSHTVVKIRTLILRSLFIVGVTNSWLMIYHVPARSWLLIRNFIGSANVFLDHFPNLLLSGYGSLWIVILWFALQQSGYNRFLAIIALIAIPLVFTMFTLDGSRVFILVTLPLVFIAMSEMASNEIILRFARSHKLFLALIFLSYPALLIYNGKYYQPLDYSFLNHIMSEWGNHWANLIDKLQHRLGSN